MIDVQATLDAHGVNYITSGPNVKSGHVAVCCPFCGDDPSFHLGINLTTGNWGCWRNNDHRGRSLRFLFRHLLNADRAALDALFGGRQVTPMATSLSRARRVTQNLKSQIQVLPQKSKTVKWPKELLPIEPKSRFCRPLVSHLRQRFFRPFEIPHLIRRYDLRFAYTGRFARRVVFPLSAIRGGHDAYKRRLLGWTGRDISGESERRYLTEDNGHGKAIAYLHDLAPTMLLVEGPFDALRVNWTAARNGLPIRALAFLGTAVTPDQVEFLFENCLDRPEVKRSFVCMDEGAASSAHQAQKLLAYRKPRVFRLPRGVKDFGSLGETDTLLGLKTLL